MRRSLVLPALLAPLLLLAGCAPTVPGATAAPPVPSDTPTPSPTETAAPAGLLECADLVGTDVIATALSAPGSTPDVTEAREPSAELVDLAVDAAGGLTCSWRTGSAAGNPLEYRDGDDWTYVTVQVLPDAGTSWSAMLFGDSPVEERIDVAGIETAAACGDPGCAFSAPVGDSWVQVEMRSFNFAIGGSPFGSMPVDDILASLQPIAESTFQTVLDASAEQIDFPQAAPGSVEMKCDGALDPQGIGFALGHDGFAYQDDHNATPSVLFLTGYAAYRASMYSCLGTDGDTMITVGRELAPVLAAALEQPDTSTGLEPVELQGAADGEVAARACADTTSYCSVLFTIGSTAYQVESRQDAVGIAEAMIAQAR
ncbi:MAG TPA: hypothetical protein VIL55_09135 [Naasia sp.]|jgi:hypothetical protein